MPSSAGKQGRPYQDHRRVPTGVGILWIARTGAPWSRKLSGPRSGRTSGCYFCM
ncbi:MAG: hypothetical protein HY320_10540 [Armatimonadetes bacterium]|nr:hypothetical protein [Armatimonadota bacterium]